MKETIYKIIGKLLIKSGMFRSWYKHQLSGLLYDLELSEDMMSRKEIYDKLYTKLKQIT